MGMGSCSSYPTIRKRYSRMREEMMDKVGIPANIQLAIMANHEPNEKGVYPDWADKDYVVQISRSQNCKSVRNASLPFTGSKTDSP